MSKEILRNSLNNAKSNYSWNLYFINFQKKRGQNVQAYECSKRRFSNNVALSAYANRLIDCVLKFQLENISEVEEYSGFNPKNACDKLAITDVLLNANFLALNNSLTHTVDSTKGSVYKGYILDGQPDEGGDSITFFKIANPIVPLCDRRSMAFRISSAETLDIIDEKICRLYLNTDSICINGILYNFTDNFEKLFNVPATRQNIKARNIQTIIDSGIISNPEAFISSSHSFDARILQCLHPQRLEIAKNSIKRQSVSANFQIPLDDNGLFAPQTETQYKLLIKYLCYKAFQEADTMDILTANEITKESL